MSDHDPRDVPDLDLPPPRGSSPSVKVPSARPKAAPNAPPPDASALGDDFGMELERGPAVSAPPGATTSRAPGAPNVAIDFKGDDDDFGSMEIERGGAMISLPPSMSGRPPASSRPASPSGRPAAPGLEVTYRRMPPVAITPVGPSRAVRILAWVLPLVLASATLVGLVKLVHRPGGWRPMALMPHAFDATSTAESGAFAGIAFVLAITIGSIGVKVIPQSYAMVVSATGLVVASLAMVTVTLVSTEEHPSPPDGALLIPYVVPFAVLCLGLGVAGRGPPLFLRGGVRRLTSALAAIAGGALVFAAIEMSSLASRLP
ncbi:MAG: hypothetical protein KF894_10340 [Labilithrix sp.]|nr:hypothetical protein [Labilithrix sp.]